MIRLLKERKISHVKTRPLIASSASEDGSLLYKRRDSFDLFLSTQVRLFSDPNEHTNHSIKESRRVLKA